MVCSASSSSDTFIVPSSAAYAAAERPSTMIEVMTGAISRVTATPTTSARYSSAP